MNKLNEKNQPGSDSWLYAAKRRRHLLPLARGHQYTKGATWRHRYPWKASIIGWSVVKLSISIRLGAVVGSLYASEHSRYLPERNAIAHTF